MAHQQLPLNSLGVGGNNHHILDQTVATASHSNNNSAYQAAERETEVAPYSALNVRQENHHQHSNAFNDYQPPPYAEHMEDRLTGSGQCPSASSRSSGSVLYPHHHQSSVSRSLPPITSFGVRQSSMTVAKHLDTATIGPSSSQQVAQQQQSSASPIAPLPSTSSHSSATCSPSPSSYTHQHTNNINNHHPLHHHFSTSSNTSHFQTNQQTVQKITAGVEHPISGPSGQMTIMANSHGLQQQYAGNNGSGSSISTGAGTVMLDNHNFQLQNQQQMHSPAYSAQLANSISNPGSIMSAAPESPSSSIRSPSVRSNYSLRLINSTPDPFQTQPNNNGNSEHSYSLDAFIHQDGQTTAGKLHKQSQYGSDNTLTNHHMPPLQNLRKTPQSKNAKRNYTPKGPRMKTPGIPMFHLDGPNPLAAILGSPSASSDGPTVRQHLQQQQAAQKQRLQQEIMMTRMKGGETFTPINAHQGNNADGRSSEEREDREGSQIESAPPSVAQNSTAVTGDAYECQPSSSTFGGFQLAEWSSSTGGGNLGHKITVISANTPVHQLLKAESLSPSKRSPGSRSRGGGQGGHRRAAAMGNQLQTSNAPSSAEALANTIASVASGGGSLEEFEEKLSNSTPTAGASCSPSTSMLPNSANHPAPLNPTAPAAPIPEQSCTPIGPKRRKVATQNAKMNSPQVLASMGSATPTRQMEVTESHQQPQATITIEKKAAILPQTIYNQMPADKHIYPTATPQIPKQQQRQQCRIHVQNPPQNHCDFPVTGTKIQVVHMQPSPATSAISAASASSQTDYSPRQFHPGRPPSEMLATPQPQSHHQQSPFAAPLSTGSSVEMLVAPPSTPASGAMCSPRGMMQHSVPQSSLYQAAPPQPPQQQRQQFLTPPTPGQQQQPQMSNIYIAGGVATPPVCTTPTAGMIMPNHTQEHIQQQDAGYFQYPNPLLNRQPQQHYEGSTMPKYLSPTSRQLQQFSQQASPHHPHMVKQQKQPQQQEMLTMASNSPHSQIQFSPMGAPAPPSTPMPIPSPQIQSPYGMPPPQGIIQTPHQTTMAYHQQQQSQMDHPQQSPHYHTQHSNRQSSQQQQICMSPSMAAQSPSTAIIQMPNQQHPIHRPPSHQSPMQVYSLHSHQQQAQAAQYQQQQQQRVVQVQQQSDAYMSPPQQSPQLQQLLHHHHPPSSNGCNFSAVPGGPPQQPMKVFAAAAGPVCPAPPTPSSILSLQQPPPPPRVQLSRAQLLSRHTRELEAQKYGVKLYHLQRTIKALVYKNGALSDELTRLNQRIDVVTEERKILAKRLQHYERNRIRRIQTHFRKAAAAAAAAAKEEESCESQRQITPNGAVSSTNCEQQGTSAKSMEQLQLDTNLEPLQTAHFQLNSGSGSFPGSLKVSPRSDTSTDGGAADINGAKEHPSNSAIGSRMTLRSRMAS